MPVQAGGTGIDAIQAGADTIAEARVWDGEDWHVLFQNAIKHDPQTWSWDTAGEHTWTAPKWVKHIDVIAMGGGAGGGGWQGGHGGLAGKAAHLSQALEAPTLSITVGAGGAGASKDWNAVPSPGESSSVGELVAAGGSGSEEYVGQDGPTVTVHGNTYSGGSGGERGGTFETGGAGGTAAGGGVGGTSAGGGRGGDGKVWIVGYDYRGFPT